MENYIVIDGEKIELSEKKILKLKEEFNIKRLTYKDIAKYLFCGKKMFFSNIWGQIINDKIESSSDSPNIASTKAQLESLLCLNKLANVAVYLNEGWVPCWDNEDEDKYYHFLFNGNILINFTIQTQLSLVYFKSEDLAEKAVKILGEDCIKKAFAINH
jgi:hypothetical protein